MEFLLGDYVKIFIVALMLYAIIYVMLKKLAFFDDERVGALVAFLAVIIVSFSGIVTYVVAYAVNIFAILLIVFFFIFVILMFLGIDMGEITGMINKKVAFSLIGILFLLVLFKGFFGVNNTFDLSDPQEDPYQVNTEFNTGVDDITGTEVDDENWLENFSIDSDLLAMALFFLLIGGAIYFMG